MEQHLKEFYNSRVKTTEMPEFENLSQDYKTFLSNNASFNMHLNKKNKEISGNKRSIIENVIVYFLGAVFLIVALFSFIISSIIFLPICAVSHLLSSDKSIE